MINKNQFTNIAKKILKSHKGLKDPRIMHPEREWVVGLVVSVVIFATVATWSYFVYLKYQNLSTDNNDEQSTETVVYNEALMKSALQEFSSRRKHYEELLAESPSKTILEELSKENIKPDSSILEGDEATSTEFVVDENSSTSQKINEVVESEIPVELEPTDGELISG